METPLVYIIVLNYYSLDDTLGCIKSIQNLVYSNFRLLVIDNASSDGSGRKLDKILAKTAFLQLRKNIGYAGGNNQGIKIALSQGADYILICNPDIRLQPESIQSYIDTLEANPSIGALNPIQLSPDGINIDNKFQKSILSKCSKQHVMDDPCDSLWETSSLLGAALMLPVSTINKIGGFDPLYFAYGEEEDLCRRIKSYNLKLVVTEKSPVIHLRTKENGTVSDFVLFLRLKGSYLYKLKDPALGYRYAVKKILYDFILDLFFKRKTTYPFDLYPIKYKHLFKTAFWILFHLNKIRRHRKIESKGAPYI